MRDEYECPVPSAQDDCDRLQQRRRERRYADLLGRLTDAEWDRLGGIRLPSLMDGFSVVLPSLPDPERRRPVCWCETPLYPARGCCPACVAARQHESEDWAGPGFTGRNHESTT